jgi:4-hydroxy-3-polyprenylbenzoate decarboxylase
LGFRLLLSKTASFYQAEFGGELTGHAQCRQEHLMMTEQKISAQKIGERKPVAYGDMRGWIKALDAAGELKRIDAEVDWSIELGTVARLAQGTADGPALIFNNIRDYGANSRCRQVMTGTLASYRRLAMLMGLAPETHPRELVKLGRTILTEGIAPKIVKTGPVKENVVKGDDVDLNEFPVPQWNRIDGGRYILTYGGVVTKDPNSGIMNVGV